MQDVRPLDAIDRRILDLLTADGRAPAAEVGRAVGLSAAAAKRRIDRLVDDGYISGCTAVLDHRRLGEALEAVVEVRFEPSTQVADIDSAVAGIPEVVEQFTLAGDPDALVRVRVRSVEHLKDVIDLIRRGRSGRTRVAGTKTLIVLHRQGGPAGP